MTEDAMVETFQSRVQPWMMECFGAEIASDMTERCDRFVEEVFELVQALGYDEDRILSLRNYTYCRPVGEPDQEVGGVMVTLAALCLAAGLDMHAAGETELTRISTPETIARIRKKQAAKPTGSALPIAAEARQHGDGGRCDLCVGECRGHSLGRPEEWEPEAGSRASPALPDTTGRELRSMIAEARAECRQCAVGPIARPLIHRLCDAAEAHLSRQRVDDRMRAALKPFAAFAESNVGDDGWEGLGCQRERIVDWFGPSDFREARAALEGADHG